MDIRNLQQIDKAPHSGYMLLYTRQDVIFEKYDNIDNIKNDILSKVDSKSNNELLEVHLFDNEKEYRAIKTTSHRIYQNSAKDAIECVVSDDEVEIEVKAQAKKIKNEDDKKEDDESNVVDIYTEDILLDNDFNTIMDKITVINYIIYDNNGMAEMYNYRLTITKNYGGANDEK